MSSPDRTLFVIGDPIRHSLSPVIHNFIFQLLGESFSYKAELVKPSGLQEFTEKAKRGFCPGFNVTIPHKESIIPFLYELDESAETAGAVNTVKLENNRLTGFNTDIEGCIHALTESGWTTGGTAVIFGSGGAARAGIAALISMGQKHIVILNRDTNRAEKLSSFFSKNPSVIFDVKKLNEKNISESISSASLVINSTPVGMWPDTDRSPIRDISLIRKNTFVFDMVPRPYITKLLHNAESSGAVIIPGLQMLISQAVAAQEIWLNRKIDSKIHEQIMEYLLTQHREKLL
ncbi:shikimate dehydrogenase [bacterium]|nr:shikimate dehydrogenase [bacterium]